MSSRQQSTDDLAGRVPFNRLHIGDKLQWADCLGNVNFLGEVESTEMDAKGVKSVVMSSGKKLLRNKWERRTLRRVK